MDQMHKAVREGGKAAGRQLFMLKKEKVEFADAHCHLDMIADGRAVSDAVHHGVRTIITDGVDMGTSRKAIAMADGRHIFPAVGIDPENAMLIPEGEIGARMEEFIGLVRANARTVVAVGEIGLDYAKAGSPGMVARQKAVFGRMLDFARDAGLPVSVHSRDALPDVMSMLDERHMAKVQLHFFEGDVLHAKEAERKGYMISIPPMDSSRRRRVIKDVAMDSLLAESDAPAAGQSPKDVVRAVGMVAEVKGLEIEKAAEALTANTKRFFGIHSKSGFIRS